jgi:hypothetical protein
MTKEEATAKWQEMKETKYSDKAIKKVISWETTNHTGDIANQLKAMNMIAYNQMVDSRIEKARLTWEGG